MCWRFVFLQAADSSLNQRDQGRVDEWQQSRKQILERRIPPGASASHQHYYDKGRLYTCACPSCAFVRVDV